MTVSYQRTKSYATWYEFKIELERHLGRMVNNSQWLKIKPGAPLPWNEVHMKQSFFKALVELRRLRKCPRCGGHMFLERDFESWYEECLQCSYTHELWSTIYKSGTQQPGIDLTPTMIES